MNNMFNAIRQFLSFSKKDPYSKQQGKIEQKASLAQTMLALSPLGQPKWTPRNYQAFADEGYRQNVIVHRCITEIARSIGIVPIGLRHKKHHHKQSKKLESDFYNHPFLTLLKRPNPAQAGPSFIENVISSWLISGNAYIESVLDDQGKPLELYVLRSDRMKIIPGSNGLPMGYQYDIEGKSYHFEADPLTGESNILHLKLYNPLDDWYGLSPIEAAAFSIDQHNAAGAHNQALLQNGARPTGALIYRPKEGSFLTDVQRQTLKEQLTSNYQGAQNAGKVLVLEGDFDWREMSLRPKDMDFVSAKNIAARDIAQAFGVPPVLVGIPSDATYANMAEARIALWEQTIIPLLDQLTDSLNNWLVPFYGEDLELVYDLDHVPALAPRRQVVWEKLQQADFLTINEKRQALGYPPLKNGDHLNKNI